jgi:hypothetical protein
MSWSGLSDRHRAKARRLALHAAELGLAHAAELHYTQGPDRWEGIDRGLKAWRGEFPRHADCSSFATWVLWNGLSHYGVRDVVNGANWRAGYTGTMIRHGYRVQHMENIQPLDLALYGNPLGPTGHVAICVGDAHVISFGSEPGPFKLYLNYRDDLKQVRRYL